MRLKIRRATLGDATTLAVFNSAMALETEGKVLLPKVIGAGVRGLLRRPGPGFYTVAEADGEVIAALMVTKEWSDWRDGTSGGRLYRDLQALAAKERSVSGFRLYVERHNRRAQSTYRASGMDRTHYLVYEQLKPGVRFFRPA